MRRVPKVNHFKRPKNDQVVPCDRKHCSGRKKSKVWPIDEDPKTKPKALSYINIDAYEPDSSGAEEEDLSSDPPHAACRRLDGICELGGNVDSLDDSRSSLFRKNRMKQMASSKDLTDLYDDTSDCQRTVKTNGKVQFLVEDQAPKCYGVTASIVSYKSTEQNNPDETFESEMVVRPKIRKQTSENHLERRKRSEKEETGHLSGSAVRNKCGSAPPGFLAQTSPENEFLFNFPAMALSDLNSEDRKSEDENAKAEDDDDIWEDLESFGEKCEPSMKADERYALLQYF